MNSSGEHADGEASIDKISNALCVVALGSLLLLIAAAVASSAQDPLPNVMIVCLSGAVLTGMYAFMGLVEVSLLRRLMALKSSLLLWAVPMTLVAYLARSSAMADINTIFHVDASLLPMTLVAATLLHGAGLLALPVGGCGLLSAVVAFLAAKDPESYRHPYALLFCGTVNAAACFLMVLLVHSKVSDEAARLQLVYRIARSVDFNNYSLCTNIDSRREDVLFLDANRSFVLPLPKLRDAYLMQGRMFEMFRAVELPRAFHAERCEY